ncbi:MAG: type IV pilus modification PilV family protein [Planctomycetota bacterium]|jgi:Tfp pilus assembly protein PilV
MKYQIRDKFCSSGFSLVEASVSLIILALISSSVLVVINRCMASTANSTLRMQAFEVARENMERLLASDSVEEKIEYGYSDKYPEIQWQTTVESFSGPSNSSVTTTSGWIQAICSAEYVDTEGQQQKIELVHWLTNLTKNQWAQVTEEKQKLQAILDQMTEEQRERWQELQRQEQQVSTETESPTETTEPTEPDTQLKPGEYPTTPEEFAEYLRRLFDQFR